MKTLIVAIALLLGATGCANVKYTLRDPGKNGDDVEVRYSGTASGATELVNAATRRREGVTAGEIAAKSVDKGMSSTVQTTPRTTGLSAGGFYPYGMGMGGYGYGFVQGGYGGQVMSPQTVMSERVSLGYGPGMLPTLGGEQPVYFPQPVSQPQVVQPTGVVECPKNRDPISVEERLRCNEENVRGLWKRVLKKK